MVLFLLVQLNSGCAWLDRQLNPGVPPSLKVGAIISSGYGGEKAARAFEYGLKLAVEEIKKNKGTDQPEIELVVLRARKSDPAELVRLALEMEKRKVAAVFCCLSPAEARAFFPLASRLKRPVFLQSEVSSPLPSYVYSLSPSEESKGAALSSFALSALGKRKAAIFYSRGDRFQREKAYSFEKHFSQSNGEVALIRPVPLSKPKEIFRELARAKPGVFFLALRDNDRKQLLKELPKSLKHKAEFLFGDDLSKNEGMLTSGGYFVRFYPLALDALSWFSQRYSERFKSSPLPVAFSSYLGLFVLNEAVIKAKTVESSVLAGALGEVKVEKAGGQYGFSEERFLKGPVYFYQLREKGQVVLVRAEPLPF